MVESILIGLAAGTVTGFLVSAVLYRIHWENGYAVGERNGHRAGVADAQIMQQSRSPSTERGA